MKLKLTITLKYEAKSEDYGTNDIKKMAQIDETNFNDDPNLLYEILMGDTVEIKVEPA